MKKKIAVFGNGWSNEFLKFVLSGIQNRAKDHNVDLFTFINYSSGEDGTAENYGEKSIFSLPELTLFDGIILLTNTMNLPSEREYFSREILKHHIPAVSVEYELDGIPYLGTDTYSGVFDLTSHIIKEHGVKKILYVSGPPDNKENLLRQKAVNDALSSIGGCLDPEKDLIYGEWSYYTALTSFMKWRNSHDALPDAIVCANDEMALGVCAALSFLAIKVPEQVIVTGCDCIDLSQKIYPILSTVAREWDKLGHNALDNVLCQINGEHVNESTVYNSIPIFGESCGCKVSEERRQARRRSIIGNHTIQKDKTIYEWHVRQIDDMFARITNVNDLKGQMGGNFAYNHSFEGENFLICLVDEFVENNFFNNYTPEMEVHLHLENGHSKPAGCKFPSKELLPPLGIDQQESNLYLFLPLHVSNNIIGYAVFINNPGVVYVPESLYVWSRHIGQDLERVRQNIRMEEINQKLIEVSMTDALTGLKNRTGYDSLAVPYLQRCQKEGKLGTMIFADINRMKLINDKYGHLQGDIALRTVADAIKMTMPENWIAVRFGGDEFIMVGECKDQEEAETIKQQLSDNLEKLKKEHDLCFPLTASFGAVVMNPEENYSLEEYLRKADKAMYEMKQEAHAKDLFPTNFFF